MSTTEIIIEEVETCLRRYHSIRDRTKEKICHLLEIILNKKIDPYISKYMAVTALRDLTENECFWEMFNDFISIKLSEQNLNYSRSKDDNNRIMIFDKEKNLLCPC